MLSLCHSISSMSFDQMRLFVNCPVWPLILSLMSDTTSAMDPESNLTSMPLLFMNSIHARVVFCGVTFSSARGRLRRMYCSTYSFIRSYRSAVRASCATESTLSFMRCAVWRIMGV